VVQSVDGPLPRFTDTPWDGISVGIAPKDERRRPVSSASRIYDTSFGVSTLPVTARTRSLSYDGDDLLTTAGNETITRHSQHGLVTATTLGAVVYSSSQGGFGELSNYAAIANGAPIASMSYTRDKLGPHRDENRDARSSARIRCPACRAIWPRMMKTTERMIEGGKRNGAGVTGCP
jgi:hypothetical protein